MVTDAEVVTLAVAQQLLGINSDEPFCAGAARRLGHLFPRLLKQPGYVKRRQRLTDTIEALIAEFAAHSPGSVDNLLVVTPPRLSAAARSRRRADLRISDPAPGVGTLDRQEIVGGAVNRDLPAYAPFDHHDATPGRGTTHLAA